MSEPTTTCRRPIRRALVSVYDKSGLEDLAAALHGAGVAIVSTGSTAKLIASTGVPVTQVEDLTGFPECLDGRVKTLHPKVHAGILADRRNADHERQLDELGIEPFDLVVSNLYPFRETVASGAGLDDVVEQIDIGGPSMVRAAAKNHASVAIVTDPSDYPQVLEALQDGGFDLAARRRLAARAFAHTASYDKAVAAWCAQELDDDPQWWPAYAGLALERAATLRYGENPHQQAALYVDADATPGIAQATPLHGKEMSYNNYVDADAALRSAFDFDQPAVAIIKHANPCGIAVGRRRRGRAPQGARLRPGVGVRRCGGGEPPGDAGDGRAARGRVHRGGRRAVLRGRRLRAAHPEEERPAARAARRLRPGQRRAAPGQRRRPRADRGPDRRGGDRRGRRPHRR